ncbi:MAG: hypothetical protein JST38_05460 [Bacteroidetes bacterium]|nr:hypothetical protein [Bacteroidota bacterium]
MNKQMEQAAKDVLAANPLAEAVYVTEDGNAFLPEVKNLAENHAYMNRLPAPVEVKRADGKKVKPEEGSEPAAPEEAAEAAPEEAAKPKGKKK